MLINTRSSRCAQQIRPCRVNCGQTTTDDLVANDTDDGMAYSPVEISTTLLFRTTTNHDLSVHDSSFTFVRDQHYQIADTGSKF